LLFSIMILALLSSCSAAGNLPATPLPVATSRPAAPASTPVSTPAPSPSPPATATPGLTSSPTVTQTATLSPTPFPLYGKSLLDETYCTVGSDRLKMDVYFPQQGGPWPAVVYLHGGAWMEGDKAEAQELAKQLTPFGYLVVALNYRMVPGVHFPALIEDVKCGVRALRAHAAGYNLDAGQIGAYGFSAGGHLAALLGTSDASAGWEVGEYLEQSSRVQAVVDLSGPSDLTKSYPNYSLASIIRLTFGSSPEKLAAGSPTSYASRDDPPFLIFHGEADQVVPPDQSQLMVEALLRAGAFAQLVKVKNGDHPLRAEGMSPTRAQMELMILNFLETNLK